MGCHFLLQCVKVKSESEVAQSCPTLNDHMDCSLPGSSIYGIFQARVLEWGVIAFSASYLEKHQNPSWWQLLLVTSRNLLEKYVLDCMHPCFTKITNILTFPLPLWSSFSELFEVLSPGIIVLIFPQIKLNSQFSHCAFSPHQGNLKLQSLFVIHIALAIRMLKNFQAMQKKYCVSCFQDIINSI